MLGKKMLHTLLILSSIIFICSGEYEMCSETSSVSCFPGYTGFSTFESSPRDNSKSLIESFVSALTNTVKNSDVLTDVFEISQTTPSDFRKFVYDYVKTSATNHGMESPHIIAATTTRSIEDHLETLVPSVIVKVFAKTVAKYLQSEGLLNPMNVLALAASYADGLTEFAQKNVDHNNPESKLKSLLDGTEKLLDSVDLLVAGKGQTLASIFADEVKLAGMELRNGG